MLKGVIIDKIIIITKNEKIFVRSLMEKNDFHIIFSSSIIQKWKEKRKKFSLPKLFFENEIFLIINNWFHILISNN